MLCLLSLLGIDFMVALNFFTSIPFHLLENSDPLSFHNFITPLDPIQKQEFELIEDLSLFAGPL